LSKIKPEEGKRFEASYLPYKRRWDEKDVKYWFNRLYAACDKSCDAYDPWSGILLRRTFL
jgi:hypothetical protein